MRARSSGTTSIATISAPASSARCASSGPDRSSASRRETLLETVMTTVRTAPDDSRARNRPVLRQTHAVRVAVPAGLGASIARPAVAVAAAPLERGQLAARAPPASPPRAARAPARRRCRRCPRPAAASRGGARTSCPGLRSGQARGGGPPAPRRRRGRPVRARHRAPARPRAAAAGRDADADLESPVVARGARGAGRRAAAVRAISSSTCARGPRASTSPRRPQAPCRSPRPPAARPSRPRAAARRDVAAAHRARRGRAAPGARSIAWSARPRP